MSGADMPIRKRIQTDELPRHRQRGALFGDGSLESPYRYRLWRYWAAKGPVLVFCMLNPSTADVENNDPTVERCERRARRDGFAGVEVVNIFAFRATDPADMKKADDPVGPINDNAIMRAFEIALWTGGRVIAAWGSHGTYQDRWGEVYALARKAGVTLYALGLTNDGQPRHPLYLKNDAEPIVWPARPRRIIVKDRP